MDDSTNMEIKQILERKCSIHDGYPLDLLYISENSTDHEICYMCFQNKPIKKEEILNLRQIFFQKEDSVLQNFPPLSDQNLYKSLDQLCNQHLLIDQSILQISAFFKELEEKILTIISNLQKEMKDKIENLVNLKTKFVETYNEISSKKELKQLLISSTECRSTNLHDMITTKFKDSEINTKRIQDLVDQFGQYRSSINFDGPVKIEEAVCSLIKQIDFFSDFNAEKYTNVILEQELNGDHKYKQLNTNQNKKTNVDIILDLIANKTNYCLENTQKELEELLRKYSLLLNQVELKQPLVDEEKRNSFMNLNDIQLESVRVLSQKIQDIEESYKEEEKEFHLKNKRSFSSTQSSSPSFSSIQMSYLSPSVQPQSLEIYNNLFSGKAKQYQKIEALLREYPIFELENISSSHRMIFFNMLKSQYADSQNLHIEREQNLDIVIQKINKKGHAICFSNQRLDKDKKYIIRLTLQSNPNTCNNLILFGLLPESNRDIAYLRDSGLTYNERADSCYTLSKIIKGDPIPEINKLSINKQIEVRICLKQKIFKVASYPGYENISELDNKNRIKDNVNYRFSVELYQKDDQIVINEFMVVDHFDFNM